MDIIIEPAPRIALPAASKDQLPVELGKTDRQKVTDFAARLANAVKEIATAIEKSKDLNKDAKELVSALGDRSWFGGLKANLSGSTDKELAFMVQRLGHSVEVTQDFISLILNIQSEKNRVLRGFNDALVKKIAAIQGDTKTLNDNQRQAALHFLGELQSQLDEQIRHQELVDSHDDRLTELDRWREEKEEIENGLLGQVAKFEEHAAVSAGQLLLLEDHASKATAALTGLDELSASNRERIAVLEEQKAALSNRVTTLEGQGESLKIHVTALEIRLAKLEAIEQATHSIKATLLRHLLPGLALATALAAMFLSLHS